MRFNKKLVALAAALAMTASVPTTVAAAPEAETYIGTTATFIGSSGLCETPRTNSSCYGLRSVPTGKSYEFRMASSAHCTASHILRILRGCELEVVVPVGGVGTAEPTCSAFTGHDGVGELRFPSTGETLSLSGLGWSDVVVSPSGSIFVLRGHYDADGEQREIVISMKVVSGSGWNPWSIPPGSCGEVAPYYYNAEGAGAYGAIVLG